MKYNFKDFPTCPICGAKTKISLTSEYGGVNGDPLVEWLMCETTLHADAVNFGGERTHFTLTHDGFVYFGDNAIEQYSDGSSSIIRKYLDGEYDYDVMEIEYPLPEQLTPESFKDILDFLKEFEEVLIFE
jgi:hypothetical protein